MLSGIEHHDLYRISKKYRRSKDGPADYERLIGEHIEKAIEKGNDYFEEDDLLCPIGMELILEPARIMYCDNSSSQKLYEYNNISRWTKGNMTCPMTRKPIKKFYLAGEVKQIIQDKLWECFNEYYYELPDNEKRDIDEAISFLRLIQAIENDDSDQVLQCLNNDVNVNKDNRSLTPLQVATSLGKTNVAELLLNRDADVNAKDSQGRTALHHAASSNNTNMVNCLLKAGAKANVKDNDGKKPLSFAKNKEIIGLFKSLTAKCLSNVMASCLLAPFSVFCGR
ncbi:MAG: ankyrin repeat domain-containing protein [Rickettsiales bacterium]|jgi:hypothetical protein|nr:ankyrin repeat domain-containing protein [Rickettsiales bacterium]